MSDKILPCPFCGCETIRVHKRTCDKDTPYNSADRAYPLVRCYGCGASAESDDWTDIDTAINRWNRRAPAVPVMGELTDRQLFNVAFNLSAEFGPEFTQANKAFAMAVIEQYRHAMSNTSITQAEHDAKDARIRELESFVSVLSSHIGDRDSQLTELRLRIEAIRNECVWLREVIREAGLAIATGNATEDGYQVAHDILKSAIAVEGEKK